MYNYHTEKETRIGTKHESLGMNNEDQALIFESPNCVWMGVFDGVSHGGGGSIAATLASQSMESVLRESSDNNVYDNGLAIMKRAQESILNSRVIYPEKGMIQTTGAIACIDLRTHFLSWFSIGDSAIFICHNRRKLKKLTVEDTDIGILLSQGKISAKEAAKATVGHELNRWLGMNVTPESIDLYVRYGQVKLKKNDIILVCSDGLYSKVPEAVISRILHNKESTATLVKTAKLMGSKDDITAICAKPNIRNLIFLKLNGLLILIAILIIVLSIIM